MSQNSFTLSLNSVQPCEVSDLDELCTSPPPRRSLSHRLSWRSRNQSVTTAVLCRLLHCHQYKWTLFENRKVRKFDVCRKKKKKKSRGRGSERGCGDSIPSCPSVVFLAGKGKFISPVESAMSRWSLWLTSHPGCPADYICSAQLGAKETDRRGRNRARIGGKRRFLVFLHLHSSIWFERAGAFLYWSLSLSAVSGTTIVFVPFEFRLVNPLCGHRISPAGTLVRKVVSSRTSQSRQWSCGPILVALFIPGQL